MGSVGNNQSNAMAYADTDAYGVLNLVPVNEVDSDKVNKIAVDIEKNGWNGLPILYSENYGILLTGSHRQAALQELDNDGFDLSSLGNIAVNVDDIIEKWSEETGNTVDDIQYDNLGAVFEGTWLEKYKKYIEEW